MGNAITNPHRFIEKKIAHEIFGARDPQASLQDQKIWEECNKKNQHIIDNMIKNDLSSKNKQAQFQVDFATHSFQVNKCFRDAHN